jgi:hypothetical protein
VFVPPSDLAEEAILGALSDGWMVSPASLSYRPVGFGSHHWRADQAGGPSLFVTVDDLDKQRRGYDDTRDAAFARLAGAFGAARALADEARLEFVVAPLPGRSGQVIGRITGRYSLVVHPFLPGRAVGGETYPTPAVRNAVVDLLVKLHRSGDVALHLAHPDDAALPNGDDLYAALDDLGRAWDTGPYGEPARRLLAEHAGALRALIPAYAELAETVHGDTGRMVVTHGEPSASNVVVNDDGLHLIDWESARIGPPERDLWSLSAEDPAILDRYAAVSGRAVNATGITFYRLWYDLFEIGGYLRLFREPHGEDADAAESWENLQHYLRPAARWPRFVSGLRSSRPARG